MLCSLQIAKSSNPWPGAVWTSPVPVSTVTWSPDNIGIRRSEIKGCWHTNVSRSLNPQKKVIFFPITIWVQWCDLISTFATIFNLDLSLSERNWSLSSATTSFSPEFSDSAMTYLTCGLTQMARLAGRVHGVVVQIATLTPSLFATGNVT